MHQTKYNSCEEAKRKGVWEEGKIMPQCKGYQILSCKTVGFGNSLNDSVRYFCSTSRGNDKIDEMVHGNFIFGKS